MTTATLTMGMAVWVGCDGGRWEPNSNDDDTYHKVRALKLPSMDSNVAIVIIPAVASLWRCGVVDTVRG